MTRFARWMVNLVIVLMPVIAGCIGPPVVDEGDVAQNESAIVETGDEGCVQAMFRAYEECRAVVCPGKPPVVPGYDDVCRDCMGEAERVYEECQGNEFVDTAPVAEQFTVRQWHEPDYRIDIHAAPTEDECVTCAWLPTTLPGLPR